MAEPLIAGGPLGLESEPLPKDEAGAGAAQAEDQKAQPQASEETFSKSQVEEMISAATKGMVTRDEMELHVGRVRSQLDQARNQERSSWQDRDRAYQQRIHELSVKDMDENARAKYERDLYAGRMDELEDRLFKTESELEATKSTATYLKALKQSFDVDVGEVDLSDINALSQSAFTAAANAYQKQKQELEALRAQVGSGKAPAAKAELKKAPEVVTQQGGAPPAAMTMYDMRKAVSQGMGLDRIISEEELFELAEHSDVTGVNLDPVIRALEAELAKQQE